MKGNDISKAEKRAYAREDLIYNVTEDLLVLLEEKDISKQDLARKLGKSKSYVSQILSGSRNLTLGTLSDICFAINVEPKINFLEGGEPCELNISPGRWIKVEAYKPQPVHSAQAHAKEIAVNNGKKKNWKLLQPLKVRPVKREIAA